MVTISKYKRERRKIDVEKASLGSLREKPSLFKLVLLLFFKP